MKISVLIPCHNEEKSIQKCVQSCLDQTRKPDQILVVNDGSTDASLDILKTFGKQIEIISIYPATGNKSHAQEAGIKYITGDVFIATDGDTIMDSNFISRVEYTFRNPKVAAMGGYVKSLKNNWLTACRAYDYTIGQVLHKQAQNYLGFILVIPGAAGAFRTEVFQNIIRFDHDTLTEDLDFTYKLNKNGFKIVYDRQAIVYTQDPPNLNSYVNQMRRWFGGGWQNLKKHFDLNLFSHPGRSLELSLTYFEGLVFSLLLFLIPIINLSFALKLFAGCMVIIVLEVLYTAYLEKRMDLLRVVLFYPFIMYVNAWIFLEQFFKEIILSRKNLVWFHPDRVSI